MQKSKIAITDERRERRDEAPLIDGCNYFTGKIAADRNGHTSIYAEDENDWWLIWHSVGEEAPGPLPPNAIGAFFMYANNPGDVTTSAEKVTWTEEQAKIDWKVSYSPTPEGKERRINYAVVLLPKTEAQAARYTYVDIVAEAEERKEKHLAQQRELAEQRRTQLKRRSPKAPRPF